MGGTGRPFGSRATHGGPVIRRLLYINRRSGVAHADRLCEAIASVPSRYLRLETYDPARPRRLCSRCWEAGCPRSRAFAGTAASVTEPCEGNPRSGLTGADAQATPATERAAGGPDRLESTQDEDLRGRGRLDLWNAGVCINEPSNTDRTLAVSLLGSPESAAVLAPDDYGKAPRARVVEAHIEERGRSVAVRGVLCSDHRSPDGCDSADHVAGALPADCASARCETGGGMDTFSSVRTSSGAGAGQKDGRPGQGGESAQHGTCLSFEGCAQKEPRPRGAGGLGQNEGCGHRAGRV